MQARAGCAAPGVPAQIYVWRDANMLQKEGWGEGMDLIPDTQCGHEKAAQPCIKARLIIFQNAAAEEGPQAMRSNSSNSVRRPIMEIT